MSKFSRGQLARAANVGLETIRFYEKQGLLPEPGRNGSGYRQYSEADLARLKFIGAAKQLGFTLQETNELLSIAKHPLTVCPDLRTRAEIKIEAIELKIRNLYQVKQLLSDLIDCCSSSGKACDEKQDFCASLIALGEDADKGNTRYQAKIPITICTGKE